ncbi:glycosyltransferase [Bifidobacterium boum]|uniref:glycosyltransferase n=1 Tax=Bifidobacterium boum TaxID=78343 RepID=UPI00137740CE|nr:glycosyltransferase [Bifidobacterium boum]
MSALVVLYNTLISDSPSVSYFISANIPVYVCDNTTNGNIKRSNVVLSQQLTNFYYLDMHGNEGLAKAYNKGIEKISTPYVIFSDDDTIYGSNYLPLVRTWIFSTHADVLVPIVREVNSDTLISPCVYKHCRFAYLDSLESCPENFFAINSGLVVRRDIFDSYKYNEQYFLEMIDYQFIRDMRKEHKNILLMKDNLIYQHSSIYEDSYQSRIVRYNIDKKDTKIFYSNGIRERTFYYLRIAYKRMKLVCEKFKCCH